LGLLATLGVRSFDARGESSNPAVPYPAGYRQWTFLHGTMYGPKSTVFGNRPCEKPCTAGMMYFYANDKAMTGLRTGTFADGSIFVDEVLELHGNESDGGGKEGPRRGVAIMIKNQKRHAATGGWGYGTFDGENKPNNLDEQGQKKCFQCHLSRKDKDYVFTAYRER
jgi:hypothetical protein